MIQTLFQRQFSLSYSNLAYIRNVLEDKAKTLNLTPELIQNIKLVCSEYCANLLEHQATVATSVTISYGKSGADNYFTIKDNGSPWSLLSQQLVAAELPEYLVENGMGLALIKSTFPDFDYQSNQTHNLIRFRLPRHKQQRQIVIVDDCPSQLALLASFLERDYQLALFSQADEALRWLTKNHCDLVLTDLHMPEINGFDFRQQVAKIAHHQLLPFIFLSGDTMTDTLSAAAHSGVDDFLAKPITQQHLLIVLDRVLERHLHLCRSFEAQLQQQITPPVCHTNIHPLAPPLQLLINQEPLSSGDFIMQHQQTDGSKLIILADQMGHGLAAKANGSACFGFICGLLHNPDISPQELFATLNTRLYQASETTSLICLIVLHLTLDNRLTVYNAGMPKPIFFNARHQVIQSAMGLLGLFESVEINCWHTQLSAGDSLHCYSDGLNESIWPEDELKTMQAMTPQQRHQYLWQHTPENAADDCSLITLLFKSTPARVN